MLTWTGTHTQELCRDPFRGTFNEEDPTHVKVRHVRFFKLMPESLRDDVHRDIVSDDSVDAGQRGLHRTEDFSHV